MNLIPSTRTIHTIEFFICFFILAIIVYLQIYNGLELCALCVLQRLLFFCLGLVFLAGALHVPNKSSYRKIYHLFILILSLLGVLLAGKQVWLEHLPANQIPQCGPTLDYLFQNFAVLDVLKFIVSGAADCARSAWTFFDMSFPTWSLMFFSGFGLVAILQIFRD